MGGLFTSFGVGVSGLTTAQAALNATAHNITNVDTKGYTRQQILISDFLYHKVQTQGGEGKNQSGLGSLLQDRIPGGWRNLMKGGTVQRISQFQSKDYDERAGFREAISLEIEKKRI
jgi:flagellar hook protein FlgE